MPSEVSNAIVTVTSTTTTSYAPIFYCIQCGIHNLIAQCPHSPHAPRTTSSNMIGVWQEARVTPQSTHSASVNTVARSMAKKPKLYFGGERRHFKSKVHKEEENA